MSDAFYIAKLIMMVMPVLAAPLGILAARSTSRIVTALIMVSATLTVCICTYILITESLKVL